MADLDELERRYGLAQAAPAPVLLEDLEARYGLGEPLPPKPPSPMMSPTAREVAEAQIADAPEPSAPQKDDTYYSRADRLIFDVLGPDVSAAIKGGQKTLAEDPEAAGLKNFVDRGKKVGKASTMVATGALGGGVAGVASGAMAPAVTTVGGRLAAGVLAGSVGSAASQAATDVADPTVSFSEMPKRAGEAALAGSLVSAGGGVLSEGARTSTGQAVLGWIKDKYNTVTRQLASRGSDPTHAVRAFGDGKKDAEHVLEFIEKRPEIDKALGDPSKVNEAARAFLRETAPKTAPVYARVDAAAGEVPIDDVVRQLDKAIDPLKKAGKEPFREALEEVRNNVLREAKELGAKTWTHQRLREWVTDAKKAAEMKVGGIAGTEPWVISDRVHEVAHGILDRRLNLAAMADDSLAPEIAQLRRMNRDISAAVKLEQLSENAVKRSTYARPREDIAGKVVVGNAVSAGQLPTAAAGYVATKAVGAATGLEARRAAADALRSLAQAVANGHPVSEAVARATAAGVPQALISAVVNRRQSPATEEISP